MGRGGGTEAGDLLGRQAPAHRAEILTKLLFVARADDDAEDSGAAEQPVDGDLRQGLAGFGGDGVQGVDDGVERLVIDRRLQVGGLTQAADGGQGLATADLAGQPAPAQRAPAMAPPPWSIPSGISSCS